MTAAHRGDVTVTVCSSGKIEVNGVLVAEVDPAGVTSRDDLAHNLTLHRVAYTLLEQIQRTITIIGKVDGKERAGRVDGLVDGLLDVTVPHPMAFDDDRVPPMPPRHDRPYLAGYEQGRALREVTAHLASAVYQGDVTATSSSVAAPPAPMVQS